MDVSLLLADPMSEHMAAFSCQTGSSDLFVFKPGEPRTFFSHKAVCTGKVKHALFAPRNEMLDSHEERTQWLNRSQLYFLNQHMDLLTFTTNTEQDRLVASSKQLVIDDCVAMTPFYLLLGKHRQEQKEKHEIQSSLATRTTLPSHGSDAIKELLHTPAHVLPSASSLCSMFVRSFLISNTEDRTRCEKELVEEEMENEKKEEDSDEELAASASRQDLTTRKWGPVEDLGLNKAQERELRKVKKMDHSWVSTLLNS